MDIICSEIHLPQERNKVNNVLVRYCGNKELRTEKDYLHPENAYLVKYFPKYYQSLALVMKPQHSLLSKIKKIKKLKRFTGGFNGQIPQVDWFKILGNNHKEIEEFPQVEHSRTQSFFWTRMSLYAVKFFSWITKLKLPTCNQFSLKEFIKIWKAFSKQLRNLRRLRTLEIMFTYPSNVLKSLFNKLNGMPRLLEKLEVLKSSFSSSVSSDILQNKNVLSNLTNLNYDSYISENFPICQAIPQVCKNLKSFSFSFGLRVPPNKHDFMTSMEKFQSISIYWPENSSRDCWSYFIPPTSLQHLKLHFLDVDLTAFKDSNKQENFFDHWKEIKELETLEFQFDYKNNEEMLFTKNFMTAMLKKVSRLTSLTCGIDLKHKGIWRYEPFNAEEVPHLYEHLNKFKMIYFFDDKSGFVRFDFGFLKPFKTLKNIDFQRFSLPLTNIRDVIRLLEENARNGEFPTLKLEEATIYYPEELRDLLVKISEVKKKKSHLKIELSFEFQMEDGKFDEVKYLDQFCELIEATTVKGLEISLKLLNYYYSGNHFDEVKRVLEKYPRMRNFVLLIRYQRDRVEYIKRDGEKEQLLLY